MFVCLLQFQGEPTPLSAFIRASCSHRPLQCTENRATELNQSTRIQVNITGPVCNCGFSGCQNWYWFYHIDNRMTAADEPCAKPGTTRCRGGPIVKQSGSPCTALGASAPRAAAPRSTPGGPTATRPASVSVDVSRNVPVVSFLENMSALANEYSGRSPPPPVRTRLQFDDVTGEVALPVVWWPARLGMLPNAGPHPPGGALLGNLSPAWVRLAELPHHWGAPVAPARRHQSGWRDRWVVMGIDWTVWTLDRTTGAARLAGPIQWDT